MMPRLGLRPCPPNSRGREEVPGYHRLPMLHRLDLRGAGAGLTASLPRPEAAKEPPVAAVQAILADVKERGDAAVRDLTERLDGVSLDGLRVAQAELDAALGALPTELREALVAARDAVEAFHRGQLRPEISHARDGVVVREIRRPVARAGLY